MRGAGIHRILSLRGIWIVALRSRPGRINRSGSNRARNLPRESTDPLAGNDVDRRIEHEFEQPVVSGLVVPQERLLVDFASYPDDVPSHDRLRQIRRGDVMRLAHRIAGTLIGATRIAARVRRRSSASSSR